MSENKMSELIKASLDGVKNITNMDTVVGQAIHTPSGVTVIPVSKLTVGFAGGGFDFGTKKVLSNQNFGTGSGSGVCVTPLAFLTIGKNGEINLINVQSGNSDIEKITSLIEKSPQIVEKIKSALS